MNISNFIAFITAFVIVAVPVLWIYCFIQWILHGCKKVAFTDYLLFDQSEDISEEELNELIEQLQNFQERSKQ